MKKKYPVKLSNREKERLLEITRKGKNSARVIKRANILLLASEGETYEEIAEKFRVGNSTAYRTRKRFAEKGLDNAINECPRTGAPKILDRNQESFVLATACTNPPEGRICWTMQLLADRLVKLEIVDNISDETVRRILKKGTQTVARETMVYP